METITLWINQTKQSGEYLSRGINNAIDIAIDLKCNRINRIYMRLTINANLPQEIFDNISRHSMRAGAAQGLPKRGARLPLIMNKGRWSKTDTDILYPENSSQNSTYQKLGYQQTFWTLAPKAKAACIPMSLSSNTKHSDGRTSSCLAAKTYGLGFGFLNSQSSLVIVILK